MLNSKLRGHYNYYGRIGNRSRLWDLRRKVEVIWKRALGRRSQRGITWRRMIQLLKLFPLLTPTQALRT